MPSLCTICNHPDRAEIENAILSMTDGVKTSIEVIAEQYDVSLSDLKMHALFHTPLVDAADIEELRDAETLTTSSGDTEQTVAVRATPRDSLTRRMKLREADLLAAVGNEYLVTMKTMGRRINKLAQVSEIDIEDNDRQLKLAKLLTKPMVDLYVGLGGEIRQTVKTMAELDRLLNGPEDSATSGLVALAKAIQGSDKLDG